MGLKELCEGKRDMFEIAIENIRPGRNPRKDFSSVPDRAVSLFNMGQLTPIEVSLSPDGKTVIIGDGEIRWRAAKYVNEHYDEWTRDGHSGGFRFPTLRCVAEPKGLAADARILRQIEHNDQAVPLSALERAMAFKELVETHKWTLERIAKSIGKTAQYVANYISMVEAPQELKDAVTAGTLSATAATKVAKASPEKRREIMDKVAKGEKVKIKDVDENLPMGIGDLKKAIKRADHYAMQAKKNTVEEARWQGVKWGLELATGMHDKEF
jgi:ParB family chromosome partitioning protein